MKVMPSHGIRHRIPKKRIKLCPRGGGSRASRKVKKNMPRKWWMQGRQKGRGPFYQVMRQWRGKSARKLCEAMVRGMAMGNGKENDAKEVAEAMRSEKSRKILPSKQTRHNAEKQSLCVFYVR